jgi:catechol 1,2-dioxygenase
LQITHPDYHTVITQLYPDNDEHLKTDSVFAVKDDLVVHFEPREGDPKAKLDLEYNIALGSKTIQTYAASRL